MAANKIEKAGPKTPAPQSPFQKPINAKGDITGSILSTPGAAPEWDAAPGGGGMTYSEIGTSGLRAFAGWVKEEFLPELQGRQGAQKFREMGDNSPVVGAIIYAIKATMRKVEWRVVPVDESGAAQEAADFVDSCRMDMGHTWEDLVAENLSSLQYGYAPHEIVYKRRLGKRPPKVDGVELAKSEYDDGLIGWRRIPIRGQDTIIQWFFDNFGTIRGVRQLPWTGIMRDIPIEKMLLFRPDTHKNSPEGRALDPETMIPTPDGWRLLDQLTEGSKVFDEQGCIRYVTARADWNDRPCYRLTFDDGFEIIADSQHQWSVQTQSERARRVPPRLRTTEEIAQAIKTPANVTNYSVPWAAALDYPEQALLFPPYLLGLWLGDGNSNGAMIACHAQDLEETLALVSDCGYPAEVRHNGRTGGNGRSLRFFGSKKRAYDGPNHILRAIGVLNNKHIPPAYLRGSIAQRMALLSGLMDSDGHVDMSGRCEFCNTNPNLAQGVAELVRSLGIGASLSTKINDHGTPTWLVKFTPTWVPFRLSRKIARCRTERQRMHHYIIAAERIENRRTVCIEVDSPSHLFLAGEGMVPTHNSILRSAYTSYYFVKRLQELEAIMGERMGGVPVVSVPMSMIEAANSGNAKAAASMNSFKNLAVNLRIDEQMGVVMPSDVWQGANGPSPQRMFSLELVTPTGRGSSMNFENSITRYNTNIMTSVLADFLTLGHEARGSQSLAVTKVDMFFQAVEGFLNSMASVYNRFALPRLWELNGLPEATMPKIEPDLAQRVDLDVLSNFVLRLSQSGMPMFPNEDLQTFLLDAGGLPDVSDPRALQAAGLLDDQLDAKDDQAQAALDAAQNPPPKAQPVKPAGSAPSNMEKILLASLARRFNRQAGPRFGVTTKRRGFPARNLKGLSP